jgi:hypothetical protein
VEAVVSLAAAGAIIGDPALFERAERVAYNALPASMTKDMWERVYLQASNEADATVQNPHVWYTDGGDSALFSLEGKYVYARVPAPRARARFDPQCPYPQTATAAVQRTCTQVGRSLRSARWVGAPAPLRC